VIVIRVEETVLLLSNISMCRHYSISKIRNRQHEDVKTFPRTEKSSVINLKYFDYTDIAATSVAAPAFDSE